MSDGADHHPFVVARTAGNLNTEASGDWDGVEGFTALPLKSCGDSESITEMLGHSFGTVEVEIHGSIAVFTARHPTPAAAN